jgi:geranylgeranyl reductase family protein
LKTEFDVTILGSGLAGAIAAREIASSGLSVAIFEEDREIGLPERCSGLVSVNALAKLGIEPNQRIVRNHIKRAVIHSPSKGDIVIDASKKNVVVIDRREFDKYLARLALKFGADIKIGEKVIDIKSNQIVKIVTNKRETSSQVFINAGGISSLRGYRKGLMQAAQYEVYGSWIDKETVELFINNHNTPGFFTWIIPIDNNFARVGVAGLEINPSMVIEKFLGRYKSSIVKKSISPIYVGGPLKKFTFGNLILVGDAAGQTKPTTGGGIYTGGMGGLLAGKAVSKRLISNDEKILKEYEKNWREMFQKEFRKMLRARKIFEKLNNKQLDKIFKVIKSSEILNRISEEADFDYHSIGIIQVLKILKNDLSITMDLIKSESKSLFV